MAVSSAKRERVEATPGLLDVLVRKCVARIVEEDRGAPTPCWTAPGFSNAGYPAVCLPRDTIHVAASHVMYRWANAEWPAPRCLHRCDQKDCINPDHLYAGTDRENALDHAYKRPFEERGRKAA